MCAGLPQASLTYPAIVILPLRALIGGGPVGAGRASGGGRGARARGGLQAALLSNPEILQLLQAVDLSALGAQAAVGVERARAAARSSPAFKP